MSTPDDKTLQVYKDNLFGGHLPKPGHEKAKDYWTNILTACRKDTDGKPDVAHFMELAHFDRVEAYVGICHLENMNNAQSGKLMPLVTKQKEFSFSTKEVVELAAIGGIGLLATWFLKRA